MATWDEIKRQRQSSITFKAPVVTWEEIKRQRGYKEPNIETPVYGMESKSPTVGKSVFDKTYDIEAIMAKKPGERTPDEDAIAQAIEIGDHEKLLQNIGSQEPAFPGPLDVSKVYYDPDRMGDTKMNVGESLLYGGGKAAEGLSSVLNALTTGFGGLVYSGLGALTGIFGDNAVSDWLYEQADIANNADLFGEKWMEEQLESSYGHKLTDAHRTAGGLVKTMSEMLGSLAVGNAFGTLAGATSATSATSALSGGSKLLNPDLITKSAFGLTAFSNSVDEALAEGASIEEASTYGAWAAALSIVVENVADGIPGVKNKSGLVNKVLSAFKRTPRALEAFVQSVGEGFEEVVEGFITPYIKRAVYNPEAANATFSELAADFALGFAASGIMQAGAGVGGLLADISTGKPQTQAASSTQTTPTFQPTAETLDQRQAAIIEKILSGEEISGNQAETIAKSPDAIDLLSYLTGQQINTDQPISSLKRDIRSLANEQAAKPVDKGAKRGTQRADTAPITAYGKAGQKAVRELYLPNQPRAQYAADMARFYQAGVTGTKYEGIDYSGILTEEQRRGAYIAGQADAETSRAKNKYDAQFTAVYKDEAGLIRNEYTPELTKEETSFINTLFKAAGVKGEFVAPTGEKGANGWIENGVVKIAQDAADPVMVVAKHEITHRMQDIAPEEYRQYRDYAVQVLGENVVERKRSFYESRGINLTYEQAMDEVAADFTEALLTDKSKIERLVSENRTLAQRFFDAVKEFVAKVKAAFKGKAAQDSAALEKYGVTIEQLEKATELWENALKSTAETVRMSEGRGLKNLPPKDSVSYSLKDSEGNALTPEQVEFFKDSKVRDKDGNLLVVYHGTNAEFTVFDFRKGGSSLVENAMYFTKNEKKADAYGENGRTIPVYLQMQNPVYIGGNNPTQFDAEWIETFNSFNDESFNFDETAKKTNYAVISLAKHINKTVYNGTKSEAEVLRDYFGFDGTIDGEDYAVFSPEQIKSIDNKNPTGDPDIRHSLKDSKEGTEEVLVEDLIEDLQGRIQEQKQRARKAERRVSHLEELNQRLRDQMKVTKVIKTNRKSIENLAKSIAEQYESNINVKELTAALDDIYTFMANGRDAEGNELTWNTLKAKAISVADDVIRKASKLLSETYEDYLGMVNYFKGKRTKIGTDLSGKSTYKYIGGVKLKLDDQYKSDIVDFGYFRKQHIGKFTISKDGVPVDLAYLELAEMFPGYFDESRYSTQPDQLIHIAEVMDKLKNIYDNPFGGHMHEAAELLANDIIESFYGMPQQAPTFADKQARRYTERVIKDKKKLDAKNERIAELIAEGRQRVKEIIRREAERREAAVAKIKEHYKAKEEKARIRREERELRNKIKRHLNTMSQMLLRPSDTKHIPEALRKPIAEFLASVDLSNDRMGEKTLLKLNALKNAYTRIAEGKSDVQAEIDPDILTKMEDLSAALEIKKLSELSRDELQDLWEVTKAIRKTVTDYNKAFAENIRETISELGDSTIKEQGAREYTESASKLVQGAANLLNMDMLDSFAFFEQLGSTMQRLFQNIRGGLDIKIEHTKEAAEYMQKLLGDTKIDEWTGNKAKDRTFKTSAGSISLTPAQVMSLYLLDRQPQAQNHMYAGGIKAAPVVTLKDKLPKITKSFTTLKVTPQDIKDITSSLTPTQRRIAEGISKFFTDVTAKWGNEVSLKLYGYEKFTVENYFPIVSDKNYISQVYGEVTDKTLKNMGITKSRIEGANNPIIIEDAFDVFTRQADQMASYHAFVIPLTDIQRVWNYKSLNGSVKQAIERRYGRRALDYFARLITDINGGIRTEPGSALANMMLGRYKAARVGMNLSVILQQPTTIIRAMVLIDPEYIAKGAAKKGNWNIVLKYAPIAQWKDWGYFNLDTGKQLKDIFLGKSSLSDTFMWAAGKADKLAWQAMWNACEYEIADKKPSLKQGSEEFYKAVAERFNEIIDRTQVVDTVLHRSQIMRSQNTLVKMATSFMSEPMKSYNLFRLAVQNYSQNKTPEARRRVARTVTALVAAQVVNSMIKSLVDALRDDEDELTYWEKWLDYFAKNTLDVVPSTFPYIKDVYSIIQGFDVKRMDMVAIGDFVSAVRMLTSDKYTAQAKIINLLAKAADLFGVPASSLKRDISMIVNNALNFTGKPSLEYGADKITYDIESTSNRSRYYDLLYRSWQMEDKTEFNKIVTDMLKHGFNRDAINNAIQSRAKKSKEYEQQQAKILEPVMEGLKAHEFYDTLPDRYKDKAEDYAKQYANAVALRSIFEPVSAAEQKKIDEEIEKLRREYGEDFYSPDIQAMVISMELEKGYTPQKWVLGADGTDKYYFEPEKYILYRVALQMVDEQNDNNDSYNKRERRAAMNLVGLSSEERRYLEWLIKQ